MSEQPPTFETALNALEERVRSLESGEVSLDQALTLFEEGVELARSCHTHLDQAEQRIAALTRGRDQIEERPLTEPSEP